MASFQLNLIDANHFDGDTTWTDARGRTWRLTFHAESSTAGVVSCAGFDVRSTGGYPVTATAMHGIPFTGLFDELQREVSRWSTAMSSAIAEAGSDERLAAAKAAFDAWSSEPRTGRAPRYTFEHFAEVARIYNAATKDRTKAVADHFGVSRTAAAKWVSRARRQPFSLLPPTSQGYSIAYPVSHQSDKEETQ